MKRRAVVLTEGAEQDLDDIITYIAEHDSTANAERVLERLITAAEGLETLPERGSIPRELLDLGIREYRQAFFKPWRMIYRISGSQVIVEVIADGRRNMQSLLARRLVRR